MKITQKRVLTASTVLCTITGVAIYILKNYFQAETDFGLREHFLTDDAKMLHYVFTPFLVVSFGLLWESHISKGVYNKLRKKRITGFLILFLMVGLVFTGQSLLSLVNDALRGWVAWFHLGFGLAIFGSIFFHSKKK